MNQRLETFRKGIFAYSEIGIEQKVFLVSAIIQQQGISLSFTMQH
jgi:hypothetical protein